jgi:hypothetical protein
VEVDLPPVPRQVSACSTHTIEHRTGQRRVGFLARVDRWLLVRTCPLTSVRMNRVTCHTCTQEDLLTCRCECHFISYTEVEAVASEPLSASARGNCQSIILRNCTMGIRFTGIMGSGGK